MEKDSVQAGQNNADLLIYPRFPHIQVETRWMQRWVDDKLYQAHDHTDKPKFYVLDMYPYPSGAGLHVGHVEGYTATDIISRYKRMSGFEVLHPMGWDAFGLPTENYAIKTGLNPHNVTTENASVFRNQCIRSGFSIDWDREIDTSKENYYRWTQKIFLDLYNHGLAYKAEAPVNWCLGCKTVLANEQVQNEHCERCDSIVELRNIEQWFFKITNYADRLINDLDNLDWPEYTKARQRNWIGRTEGVELSITLEPPGDDLLVFTPEPELLGQMSRLVIAPEYPNLGRLVAENQRSSVLEYVSKMIPQSERERKKQKSGKSGIFTGSLAINPISGKPMEIWISENVLMDEYGGIKIEQLEDSNNIQSSIETDMNTVLTNLKSGARPAVRYRLRDWLVSRERYWGAPIPIVNCKICGDKPVPEDQLPVLLPEIDDFTPTGVPPLAKSESFLNTTCPCCGEKAQREVKTLDTFVDSSWYYMRFADPHNDRAMADRDLLKRWLPVDVYIGGADHATGHLLYARFITKVLNDLGRINFAEPFVKLTHQGMILGEDGRKMSKRWGNSVNPIDVANEFGSDSLRLFEMFLGPLKQSKVWRTKAIIGSRRFIDRVWQLQGRVKEEASFEDLTRQNEFIGNVTTAIESGRFNVAVSEFMKYINLIDKFEGIGRQSYETFLKLLSPFAPFITEELWARLGNQYSIHKTSWPRLATQEKDVKTSSIPVMINGKIRATIAQPVGADYTTEEVLALLKSNPNIPEDVKNIQAKRVIYKQDKIINILT